MVTVRNRSGQQFALGGQDRRPEHLVASIAIEIGKTCGVVGTANEIVHLPQWLVAAQETGHRVSCQEFPHPVSVLVGGLEQNIPVAAGAAEVGEHGHLPPFGAVRIRRFGRGLLPAGLPVEGMKRRILCQEEDLAAVIAVHVARRNTGTVVAGQTFILT